jgi:hypothetical protein
MPRSWSVSPISSWSPRRPRPERPHRKVAAGASRGDRDTRDSVGFCRRGKRGSLFCSSATKESRRCGGRLLLIAGPIIFNIAAYGRWPSARPRRSERARKSGFVLAWEVRRAQDQRPREFTRSNHLDRDVGAQAMADRSLSPSSCFRRLCRRPLRSGGSSPMPKRNAKRIAASRSLRRSTSRAFLR